MKVLGAVFLVTSSFANNQHEPSPAYVATNKTIVTYFDDDRYPSHPDMMGQYLNARGKRIGRPFTVVEWDPEGKPISSLPVIYDTPVLTPDKNLLTIEWQYEEDTYSTMLLLRGSKLSTSGAKPLPDRVLRKVQLGVGNVGEAELAAGRSGFYVVWMESRSVTGYDVYGQAFSSAATPVGEPLRVNTTTMNVEKDVDVVPLTTGGYVVTWLDPSFGTDLRFQVVTAAGRKVGREQVVRDVSTDFDNYAVTPLQGGGFVIAHTKSRDIDVYLYDQRGTLVRSATIDGTGDGTALGVDVEELPDGDLVFAWTHFSLSYISPEEVKIQQFSPKLQPRGDAITLNDVTRDGDAQQIQIDWIGSGRVMATWTVLDPAFSDGSGSTIKGRIVQTD